MSGAWQVFVGVLLIVAAFGLAWLVRNWQTDRDLFARSRQYWVIPLLAGIALIATGTNTGWGSH